MHAMAYGPMACRSSTHCNTGRVTRSEPLDQKGYFFLAIQGTFAVEGLHFTGSQTSTAAATRRAQGVTGGQERQVQLAPTRGDGYATLLLWGPFRRL